MRSLNRALPVALAVASGLVTTGLLYTYMAGAGGKPTTVSLEPMVVAALPVDDSRALTSQDLKVVQVLQRPTGAFTSVEQLKGRLPLVTVPAGQPLLSSHLAPEGAKPGLIYKIPPGMRAATVKVNEIAGVGGFVQPGTHVDVIGVSRQSDEAKAKTLAQDVQVLAVAQDAKDQKESGKAKLATSATLLVTPEQAEQISLMTGQGSITLVLRAPGDHKIRKIAPPKPVVKPAATAVRSRPAAQPARPAAAAKPAPAAPLLPGIEVIRGNDTEVVRP